MNAVTAVNPTRYGALLAKALPKVLETKQEYEDALSMIRGLMERDENELSPEETKLLDLLVTLTDHYEEQHYPIDRSSPHTMLVHLMEARGLSHKDIGPVLGSKGGASEVLNGKRSISKAQARRLADFFHTPADLFIEAFRPPYGIPKQGDGMRSNSDFMAWLDRQLDQDPSLAKRVHECLHEAWLYRNRSALASVRRGIEEAGRGKARTIGSFAKHAHDKTD